MPQRQITISPQHDELIRSILASGKYSDENEIIQDALQLLAKAEEVHRTHDEELQLSLERGKADLEAGRYTTINTDEELNEFFNQMRAERQAATKSN